MDRLSLDRRRLWRPSAAPGSTRRANAGRCRAARCMRVAAEQDWLKLGRRTSACRSRCCGFPASTVPAAMPSSICANGTARRLVKPGQVFNRIHVDDIAGALWHLADRRSRRHLQRHRRPAGAAAGRRRLCRRADGRRAAARNSVRDRRTVAHGAVLLWREQARLESRRSRRPAIAFAFPTIASALDHMWASGDWRATARRMRQPDQCSRDRSVATACCVA